MSTSRREFLRILGTMAAGGIYGTFFPDGAQAAPKASYKVLPFSGDNFTRGHKLRDGELPKFPDVADKKTDFVIVGGGMAGLATAYFLKDQDFLLLEQYPQTGGTSNGGSYRGINYSRGAVCTGDDHGLKKQLFEELAIKPAVISAENTAWHYDGQWFKTIRGNDAFHRQLTRILADMKALNAKPEANLSQTTFASHLSGYDKSFVGLLDNICCSFFGAGADVVSADSGFFAVKALTTDSYVFDGGNSGIARTLRSKLDATASERISTNCFVWSVKQVDGGASVVYSDATGEMHRIDCKHAIVCVPPLVALRIIADLPDAVEAAWRKLEYGAFVVANVCMPKKILEYPYQSFADHPYPFGQMVMAEAPYQATGRYNGKEMGSVLTVYYPFVGGAIGRSRLQVLNRDEFAPSLVKQLSNVFQPLQNNIEQIDITRWGHGVILSKPGVNDVVHYQTDWMTYAHSTAGGGQSLEGALTAARNAADRCLAIKPSRA